MRDDTTRTPTSILDWALNPSNSKAWEAFAQRYRERMLRWCARHGLQPSDAEDVVQDVTLKLREKIVSYDARKGRFRDWLGRIIYTASIDEFRRRSKARPLEDGSDLAQQMEAGADEMARVEALNAALNQVRSDSDPEDWAIFEAMTFEKRSAAELAAQIGRTVAAVHQAKYRIRQKVKEAARELGVETEEDRAA